MQLLFSFLVPRALRSRPIPNRSLWLHRWLFTACLSGVLLLGGWGMQPAQASLVVGPLSSGVLPLVSGQPALEQSPGQALGQSSEQSLGQSASSESTAPTQPAYYRQRKRPSADGIGKVYMGREIAQVMGHRAAMWLERPSRLIEERPDLLVQLLDLPRDAVVADIGAGTGLISVRMAKRLPEGKVLAVDVQPEMLDILEFFKEEEKLDNIDAIQATESDPRLPENTVDMAVFVDAYHEFEFPREVMEGVVRSLKPNGQVVLAEYRGENPLIAIKPHHKMTQRQVRKEMKAVGLTWEKTDKSLPQQHLLFFRKPGPA